MYIFVFASLTTAGRVRYKLKSKLGVSFDIHKLTGKEDIPGCSYGLYVHPSYKNRVSDMIKELDVNLVGIYEEKDIKGGVSGGLS